MSLAGEYAQSAGKGFWEAYEAGHPYGVNEETGEPVDVYDFLSESVYDIEYRVSSSGEYRSALLMIGGGGPNVYIDTAELDLIVYWDTRATWGLPRVMVDELSAAAEELWGSR